MELSFIILAAVILLSAGAAMTLRNLVHCALCLALTFVGLAALFLKLEAEFVGFAQILVYVGAVAILVLFAVLLTQSSEKDASMPYWSPGWWAGLAVALGTGFAFCLAIQSSNILPTRAAALPDITVKTIGEQLLHRPQSTPENYLLPLLVTGVLLTAAMIGAIIIAMPERGKK